MTTLIDITTATIVKRLSFLLLLGVIVYTTYLAMTAISMILVAAFIALAVNRPVSSISERLPFGSRKLATAIVFSIIGVVVGVVVALIIPLITTQGRELAVRIPEYLQDLERSDNFFGQWLASFDIEGGFEAFMQNLVSGLTASFDALLSATTMMLNNLAIFILTIALAFLMATEAPRWTKQFKSFIPMHMRDKVTTLLDKMYAAVTGFVNGQLIVTTIASLLTLALLTLLGVPAPLSLAAVIWVTGLIPLVGNTLGALVVIAVALAQSLPIALFLTGYYIVYQQVENNVLEPIVQARTVQMTPLFILVSAIIGVFAAGFIGALLAIPVGACVKILINYIIETNNLEEA